MTSWCKVHSVFYKILSLIKLHFHNICQILLALACYDDYIPNEFEEEGFPYIRKSTSTHPMHLLGQKGEEEAAVFLKKNKYKILFRNIVFPSCEIDIIAKDKKTGEIVFIEVKTRRSNRIYEPYKNVNSRRIHKIRAASREYVRWCKCYRASLRFDIISIVWEEGGKPQIEHIKAAFKSYNR